MYSGLSPQQQAAYVSGRNRRQRAQERRELVARRKRQWVPAHHGECRCDGCEAARDEWYAQVYPGLVGLEARA